MRLTPGFFKEFPEVEVVNPEALKEAQGYENRQNICARVWTTSFYFLLLDIVTNHSSPENLYIAGGLIGIISAFFLSDRYYDQRTQKAIGKIKVRLHKAEP